MSPHNVDPGVPLLQKEEPEAQRRGDLAEVTQLVSAGPGIRTRVCLAPGCPLCTRGRCCHQPFGTLGGLWLSDDKAGCVCVGQSKRLC